MDYNQNADNLEHSLLTSNRSFTDYFDDLGETESADSERLFKAKNAITKLYHPDKQQAKIKEGVARYATIETFEKKIMQANFAS